MSTIGRYGSNAYCRTLVRPSTISLHTSATFRPLARTSSTHAQASEKYLPRLALLTPLIYRVITRRRYVSTFCGSRLKDSATNHSRSARSASTATSNVASRSKASEVGNRPRMSPDGGNAEEFETYWDWYERPVQHAGGWVERRSHPQVNVEPYWYNAETDETTFEAPKGVTSSSARRDPLPEAKRGTGSAWTLSPLELRAAMQDPDEIKRLNLTDEELGQRACYEYEIFIPRVLSWHDYQHNTFWFFMTDRDGSRSSESSRGFFSSASEKNKSMFAHGSFFRATATAAMERLERIHPINLVYLLWTFARAGHPAPDFFKAAADHLCNGLLPSLDRCSLGTVVWCFSKLQVRHERLFQRCSEEFQRHVRVQSLAPRNFQNTMLAYRWYGPGHEVLVKRLAAFIPNQLDVHDPKQPKLRQDVLFSYTCKDGSSVPADAFRISGLTVIAKAMVALNAKSDEAEACLSSMTQYVIRSAARSPVWMREPGDVCAFATVLAQAAAKDWGVARSLLSRLQEQPQLLEKNVPPRELQQYQRALRDANL